jgi:ribose/xylose/arabinose/galactoside ABC-type transport system permease subunit
MKPWLNQLGPLIALLLVYGLFALVAPASFRTGDNLELMLRQTAVVGAAAIGMTLVILSGGIDLSVGSMVALASVVTALLVKNGVDPLGAALAAVGVGAVCGLVNGALIVALRVVPFIITLGTLSILRGVAKWTADELTINPPRTWLRFLLSSLDESTRWLVLPPGVWITLLLAGAAAAMLRYSRLGRHLTAVGSNEAAARLCGVAVGRVKLWVYTLGGAAAGLAGVFQFARLNIGDPTTAAGLELSVIAAVVIGGGSLAGGEGSIPGALIGALIMTVIASACTHLGLPNYVQEIVAGAVIIAAVALDRWRHRLTS